MQRTHYCGHLDASAIGQTVNLYGWVHRARNHGKVIFVNLRDRAGIVQVVVSDANASAFALAEKLHNECVVRVAGKVRARPAGLINKDMVTGEIEIDALELELISNSEPLPFMVDVPHQEAHEELRLKYRYIDLRRPEMTQNFITRARAARIIRAYLDQHDFLEIETPVLTKATPEGARDYLVPSRNFPGQFYALPQSPQIFKQLLMAAGFDRYYQIVRCFRDEDLRYDRQPEFTQLDIEMSFIQIPELQKLMEGLMRKLFGGILGVALPDPFPQLTYAEAMARFGSDKPDLRIPFEIIGMCDLLRDCDFALFAEAAKNPESRVAALKMSGGASLTRKQLDAYTEYVKIYGAHGLGYMKINDRAAGASGVQSSLTKFLSPALIEKILERTEAASGDIIFFVANEKRVTNEALGALRVKVANDHGLVQEGWKPLWVVDFPMFEKQDDGTWTFLHHPFTAPKEADHQKLLADPGAMVAQAYDMVINGSELGGGSIRINNLEMQLAVFKILGMSEESARAKFGHLLEAFKYGYPPEGGIAFGFDRMVMWLTGTNAIRDVIAFPKTQTASCPLTQAPSEVDGDQLRELGIKILEGDEKR